MAESDAPGGFLPHSPTSASFRSCDDDEGSSFDSEGRLEDSEEILAPETPELETTELLGSRSRDAHIQDTPSTELESPSAAPPMAPMVKDDYLTTPTLASQAQVREKKNLFKYSPDIVQEEPQRQRSVIASTPLANQRRNLLSELEKADLTNINIEGACGYTDSDEKRETGPSDVFDDSDVQLVENDSDSIDNNYQELSPDIVEITERLKRQQLTKQPQPKIKVLEGTPPNPFSALAVKRGDPDYIPKKDLGRTDEFKRNVLKACEHLAKIIAEMPDPSEGEDDFVPPKGLKVQLFPHQMYGIRWLKWREDHYPGGGILADEMGLGKTVMSIGLILAKKEEPDDNEENWFEPKSRKLVPSRSTLVVCPVGCIGQWETEIKEKSKKLRVTMFHGPKRTTSAAVLAQSDIVLTTYPTLSSEIPKLEDDPNDRCRSPLYKVFWERIMLDEGHIIRNHTTHTAQSACRLTAKHRWVVTGTPVHNRPGDFFSLCKFLALSPFDELDVWKSWIGLKELDNHGGRDRIHTIGKALILRRTKEEAKIQELPPKDIADIEVTLSEGEGAIYKYLFDYARTVMNKFLQERDDRQEGLQNAANKFVAGGARKKGGKGGNPHEGNTQYSTILVLLTRLRQAALLPFLITAMLADDDNEEGADDESYNLFDDPVNSKNPCFEQGFKSAKIKAVMAELKKLKTVAEEEGRHMDKVIIVSQWTYFLDILGQHITKRGYSIAHLNGTLSIQERTEVMSSFNKNPRKPQVLLLSITAGGVGLNLTGANHMFFMEPHWNPQVERQAQDRVHRFGQTKPVFIKRFLVMDSIEPKLLETQARKIDLADGILDQAGKKGPKQGAGLGVAELKRIFDI